MVVKSVGESIFYEKSIGGLGNIIITFYLHKNENFFLLLDSSSKIHLKYQRNMNFLKTKNKKTKKKLTKKRASVELN